MLSPPDSPLDLCLSKGERLIQDRPIEGQAMGLANNRYGLVFHLRRKAFLPKKKGRRFFFPFKTDNSFLSQVMMTSEVNRIESCTS
jgi:hypothetical protein